MTRRHDQLRGDDDAIHRAYVEVERARLHLRETLRAIAADVGTLAGDEDPEALGEALADRNAMLSEWADENDRMLVQLDVVGRGMALQNLRVRIFDAEAAP